jgi:hypothetical protein
MTVILTTTLRFAKQNICIDVDSNGSESSYGPALHSYNCLAYGNENLVLYPVVYHFTEMFGIK